MTLLMGSCGSCASSSLAIDPKLVLCQLRNNGGPPSRGKGILESIAFVRYTMGIIECDALLRGRRCWGAATSDAPLHRNQSSPLSVKELLKLHDVLEHDGDCSVALYSSWYILELVGQTHSMG